MITKKELEGLSDGTRVNGYVVIQNIEERLTRSGNSSFLAGNLQCHGVVPYKVWSNSGCFAELKCNSDAYTGVVCEIVGKVNLYEGQMTLIIESCLLANGKDVPDAMDFYDSKYDANRYWSVLYATLQKNCSTDAMKVFDLVIKDYKEAFMVEFAAINHHDNCKSGLIGHTTKLVKIGSILNMYPEIIRRCGGKDILYIGSAIHDIGKVLEYCNGSISNIGKHLCHTVVGVIMVSEHEKEITELMGEKFYLNLLSIISEHAGEFGERPRTVSAYVIHLLDVLESKLASLDELCVNQRQLLVDGYKLN